MEIAIYPVRDQKHRVDDAVVERRHLFEQDFNTADLTFVQLDFTYQPQFSDDVESTFATNGDL